MTLLTALRSRKDSYPPTQIRISRPGYYQEVDIDEDPLAYFEADEYLDAGIEGKHRPRSSVRHVSPGTLDQLRSISRRRISPSRSSDVSSDSDEEDYIRFRPGGAGYERHFDGSPHTRTAKPTTRPHRSNSAPAGPTLDLTLQIRGRTQKRSAHGSSSARSVSRGPSPRIWREPSPTVWPIAEHPDEYHDNSSDAASIESERYLYERRKRSNSARSYVKTPVEREEISAVPATQKKVRFAPLPRREDF
jgi:hypothetical protein